jgi:hypothetical protein
MEPEEFPKFHDWLMGRGEKAPPQSEVVQRAYKTLGRERVHALSQEEQYKQIAQYVDLYIKIREEQGGDAKKLGLPLLIIGDQVLSGDNEQKFLAALEAYIGKQPSLAGNATN